MASDEKQRAFDEACDRFTAVVRTAGNWKQHYFGAAYSTRLTQACDDLEDAIEEMREALRKDAGNAE